MLVYFIEDFDTKEWYSTLIVLEKCFTKEQITNSDYWTNIPTDAMRFKTKESAEEFLSIMNRQNPLAFYKGEVGFEKRNLIVTEHEFINHPL